MRKQRIGIVFGGFSREREISFAGGRTVYDNLDKSLFDPIPLFVDSFGNFILLDWQYIYKGSIRDFYPPVEFIPGGNEDFQLYAESLGELSASLQEKLIASIGKKIEGEQLRTLIDFAFLCLHGPYGEDGRIQGYFELLGIPYSGSGILPSSIGINKSVQKRLMVNAGFNSPKYQIVSRDHWLGGNTNAIFEKAQREIGFPMVVKAANQGSSIGISILHEKDRTLFEKAVNKGFFIQAITKKEWNAMSPEIRLAFIRTLCDIREGIGLPLRDGEKIIYQPAELIAYLGESFNKRDSVFLEGLDSENEVILEGFIDGKEFSCIVIQDENGEPVALPPTEIRKGHELFDYRSKYLPGLSRKITPIQVRDEDIEGIRTACERLFLELSFDVYARIDGFLGKNGEIYLNDPNTTSGMMPSSFFFHQAAEIGLNPSQFLTYIIRTSLAQRLKARPGSRALAHLLAALDEQIRLQREAASEKLRVAVIFGGYSSERHISVESGRNIYEKLASSEKYLPTPVFLTGSGEKHRLYSIPVKIMLKDNADDIREKIEGYSVHPVIRKIMKRCSAITAEYTGTAVKDEPLEITYKELAGTFDVAFIALHGRPGEDGAVQSKLEEFGVPYNGSGVDSSQITIDKYRTNEILQKNGFLVAKHILVEEIKWNVDKPGLLETIEREIGYPFIAKPVDDGCSSAVKKIKSRAEFEAFAALMFRKSDALDARAAGLLKIKPKEEFPAKSVILVEELISKKDANHFLEITGGMLTSYDQKGNLVYEVFEASEALAEGEVLSLEEKFLAGQGQNITPARYSKDPEERQKISDKVKTTLAAAARVLNVTGYCRIDAFVRIWSAEKIEVIFIEVNSLPGMTPATCIFHQSAINNYKPYEFIDRILEFGIQRNKG